MLPVLFPESNYRMLIIIIFGFDDTRVTLPFAQENYLLRSTQNCVHTHGRSIFNTEHGCSGQAHWPFYSYVLSLYKVRRGKHDAASSNHFPNW